MLCNCVSGHRRPTTIQLACGDGNGCWDRVRSLHWTQTYATGSGREWYNTCSPDCAAGHYRLYQTAIRLDRVRLRGHRYFSQMSWSGPRANSDLTPPPGGGAP
jgi:hypothetical protein